MKKQAHTPDGVGLGCKNALLQIEPMPPPSSRRPVQRAAHTPDTTVRDVWARLARLARRARRARKARLAHPNHPRARLLSLVIGRKRRPSCSSTTNTHQLTQPAAGKTTNKLERDALPHLGPTLTEPREAREPPHPPRPVDLRLCPRHGAERNFQVVLAAQLRAFASGYRFRKKRPPCPRCNFHHASGRYAR